MSSALALEYLEAEFSNITKRYKGAFRFADRDRNWHGPLSVRPMLEFLSVMDAGAPMRIRETDYDDPDGLWL